jgi:hypothetical protein
MNPSRRGTAVTARARRSRNGDPAGRTVTFSGRNRRRTAVTAVGEDRGSEDSRREDRRREDSPRQNSPRQNSGREDYHDPTAGIGGAPGARSALTLRLILAAFGLVVCVAAAVALAAVDAPAVLVAGLGLLAVVAVVDLVIVGRRKRSGEPG